MVFGRIRFFGMLTKEIRRVLPCARTSSWSCWCCCCCCAGAGADGDDCPWLYSWYQKCSRMPRWSTKALFPQTRLTTFPYLSLSCQARLLTLQWSAVRIPAHRWSPFLTRCQGIFLCSATQATPVHMQKAPSDAATEFREITPKISQNQSLPLSLHVCTVW